MKPGSLSNLLAKTLLFLAVLGLLLLIFAPWSFWMPVEGLDSSWVAVLNEAFAKRWRSGQDIFFTYGPYGFLVLRQFHPDTWSLQFIFWIVVSLGLSAAFFKAVKHLPIGIALVLLWLYGLSIVYSGDAFFFSIPILACLNFKPQDNWRCRLPLYFLPVLSGIGALIKFSYAPLPLAVYFLLDFLAYKKQKKLPLLTPLFLGSLLAFWFFLGASFSDLLSYLSLSNAFSGDYGAAMQIVGSQAEILFFILACLFFLGTWLFLQRKAAGTLDNGVIFISLVLCFLVAQKAAFVRHDSHGLIAWNVLLACCVFYFAYSFELFRRISARILLSSVVLLGFFLFFVWQSHYFPVSLLNFAIVRPYQILQGNWRQVDALAANPCAYHDKKLEDYSEALKKIRDAGKLPKFEGTVDMLPSNQMELIANGFDYRPRPVFQGYAAYAPKLIQKNREFFQSERAPQNLLFGLDDIDARYPGSSDGGSWLEIFKHYDPYKMVKANLWLQRRGKPRELSLSLLEKKKLPFNGKLNLQKYNAQPLWLIVRFDTSLAGKIVNLFFKTPIVYAKVFTEDRLESYRLVPSISREGQLMSPLVKDPLGFAAQYFNEGQVSENRVKWIQFGTSAIGKYFYGGIEAEVYSVGIAKEFKRDPDPSLVKTLSSDKLLRSLKMLKGMLEIRLLNEKFIAFAHAPSDLKLSIPPGSKKLKVGIGILKEAWQEPGTSNGACFKIAYLGNEKQPLLEACIDPKANPADREEKVFELPLPKDRGDLVLSTDCRVECAWDWVYWHQLIFVD